MQFVIVQSKVYFEIDTVGEAYIYATSITFCTIWKRISLQRNFLSIVRMNRRMFHCVTFLTVERCNTKVNLVKTTTIGAHACIAPKNFRQNSLISWIEGVSVGNFWLLITDFGLSTIRFGSNDDNDVNSSDFFQCFCILPRLLPSIYLLYTFLLTVCLFLVTFRFVFFFSLSL